MILGAWSLPAKGGKDKLVRERGRQRIDYVMLVSYCCVDKSIPILAIFYVRAERICGQHHELGHTYKPGLGGPKDKVGRYLYSTVLPVCWCLMGRYSKVETGWFTPSLTPLAACQRRNHSSSFYLDQHRA